MRRDAREIRFVAAAVAGGVLAVAGWALAAGALVVSTFTAEERAAVWAAVAPRLPLVLLAMLIGAAALAVLAQAAYRRWVRPTARLREQVQARLAPDADAQALPPLAPQAGLSAGSADHAALGAAVDALVGQRRTLRAEMDQRVADAAGRLEQERSRLAALMNELAQSVVVCNLDGRVLLYNPRARLQFKALSDAPQLAAGAELIGLGRSIYTVFDRQLVAHALDDIQRRLQRGAANPSATFVTTTPGGQLLRAQMAPVREGPQARLGGFVLLLENITAEHQRDGLRDALLLELTEGQRASLGSLQAAVELLEAPDMDAATRERLRAVVRDEVRGMATRVREVAARGAEAMRTRWPLEDMLALDLATAAQRRISDACGLRCGLLGIEEGLWLRVDSFALLQALVHLSQKLADEFEVKAVQLRAASHEGRARLDLVWAGRAMSTETVMGWESEPMRSGERTGALSVRDVLQRVGGEFWFERERASHLAFFRFLLPRAAEAGDTEDIDAAAVRHDSRPEYYDFDLFAASDSARALDERRLAELSYTVFDTETTGLEPSAGDEIIQIGAARIVGGRLLRGESFEQLVDPRRSIPAAGIPIHGIRPEMVQGQPTIERVLPVFHAYARDTVLVGHNAAFDMRFLQLKEDSTGVRFDQPVLDTLLLSAVVHPNQDSHRLEAIAERFGITVVGRHTALGDALVTAEVWLKLIPLLAAMGIHTLAEAREAARRTYYARLRY